MEEKLNEILIALSEGKRIVTVKFPDTKEFKGEVIGLDLTNINWKPIKIKVLDKLTVTETEMVEESVFGDFEPRSTLKEVKRPYKKDWIKLEFITAIND